MMAKSSGVMADYLLRGALHILKYKSYVYLVRVLILGVIIAEVCAAVKR